MSRYAMPIEYTYKTCGSESEENIGRKENIQEVVQAMQISYAKLTKCVQMEKLAARRRMEEPYPEEMEELIADEDTWQGELTEREKEFYTKFYSRFLWTPRRLAPPPLFYGFENELFSELSNRIYLAQLQKKRFLANFEILDLQVDERELLDDLDGELEYARELLELFQGSVQGSFGHLFAEVEECREQLKLPTDALRARDKAKQDRRRETAVTTIFSVWYKIRSRRQEAAAKTTVANYAKKVMATRPSDAKPSAEAKPAAMDMETETSRELEDTEMADAANDFETAEVPNAAVGTSNVQAPAAAAAAKPTPSFQTPVNSTMPPPMSRPHGKAAPQPSGLVPSDSGFVQPPDLKSAESDVITTLGRTPRKAPHSGNPALVLQSDKKPPATRRRSSRDSHQKKQKHS